MSAADAYVEPGRSRRSILVLVVLLGIGVALDGVFGHLGEHWLGWSAAAALVLVCDVIAILGARRFKTLTVDAEAIGIGDEAIPVTEVVAAALSTDVELDGGEPVLGWSGRPPRRRPTVALDLSDGRRVLVPTRHPSAVLARLGVAAPAPATEVEIRSAEPADLPLLAEIDERAEVLFAVAGLPLPPLPPHAVDTAAAIFVAGAPPVGFAQVDVVDEVAHLSEVSVLPGSMKQGIGSRLIEAACRWAAAAGYPEMTLTTFADVPWNGPMYARRGWEPTDDVGPELTAIRAAEAAAGLDEVGRRVVMRRRL